MDPSARPRERLAGKILIVDDEEALREIVSARLAFEADSVRVAKDGVEAFRLIEQDPPDVLVTDLNMPERGGEELCRMVRDSVHAKTIWILILTARRGVKKRVEGLDLGADDYLEKPFDLDELAARVRVGLRMRAMQREVARAARHAAIGWVAYALGHEIRNPLAVILTNNSLVDDARRALTELWRAAQAAAAQCALNGDDELAAAVRAAGAKHGGVASALADLGEVSETNARLGRRAAAAVAALQRFAEGASGTTVDCDLLVLVEDAMRLAFAGDERAPKVIAPADVPRVLAVPRDVVLALSTALARARALGDHPLDPLPTLEITLAARNAIVRVEGPGDGTPPEELLVARIADFAPGERRSGLDVGLAHAVVALRAAGGGLSVGPAPRGGLAVEIVLPLAPPSPSPR